MPEVILDSPAIPGLPNLPVPEIKRENYGMVTYISYNEAMRIADHRFQEERDRLK